MRDLVVVSAILLYVVDTGNLIIGLGMAAVLRLLESRQKRQQPN